MIGLDATPRLNAEDKHQSAVELSRKGKAFYQSSRAFRHAFIEGSNRAMADKTS